MCVVCLSSCVIFNPFPNILLDSWKPFSLHLHYFKTSAALGFKLCIRVPRICWEISKQVSPLNDSVGNTVEICSFIRALITVLKCLKPNSFTTAVSFHFLPNYIFLLFTSLYGTLWSSWAKGPNVDNSGLLIASLDAFFLAVDHLLQWLKLSDHLWSHHIWPHLISHHPGRQEWMNPRDLWPWVPHPNAVHTSSFVIYARLVLISVPLLITSLNTTSAAPLAFSAHPLSIYNCLSLTWKASPPPPWADFPCHSEAVDLFLLTHPESWPYESERN